MKRKTKIIIIICASIAALLLITGLWLHQLYRQAASDKTIELGEMPQYTHITEDAILSRLCSIETDLNEIDTYVSGKYSVDIKYSEKELKLIGTGGKGGKIDIGTFDLETKEFSESSLN